MPSDAYEPIEGAITTRSLKRIIDYATECERKAVPGHRGRAGLHFEGGLFFATDGFSALWIDTAPDRVNDDSRHAYKLDRLDELKNAVGTAVRNQGGRENRAGMPETRWADHPQCAAFLGSVRSGTGVPVTYHEPNGIAVRKFVRGMLPLQSLFMVHEPANLRAILKAAIALEANQWDGTVTLKIKAKEPLLVTAESPHGGRLEDIVGGSPQLSPSDGAVSIRMLARPLERLLREIDADFTLATAAPHVQGAPTCALALQPLGGEADLNGLTMPTKPKEG